MNLLRHLVGIDCPWQGVVATAVLEFVCRRVCCQKFRNHAVSDRDCFLNFRCGYKSFTVFSCYFPTTWVLTNEVVQIYEMLDLLFANVKAIYVWHNFLVAIGLDPSLCSLQVTVFSWKTLLYVFP